MSADQISRVQGLRGLDLNDPVLFAAPKLGSLLRPTAKPKVQGTALFWAISLSRLYIRPLKRGPKYNVELSNKLPSDNNNNCNTNKKVADMFENLKDINVNGNMNRKYIVAM